MKNIVEWALAILLLLAAIALIFVVTTARVNAQPRPVQLWTLWATDADGVPQRALLRFTSLDACIAISYRHGFTTGETATCLPYRLGDFR